MRASNLTWCLLAVVLACETPEANGPELCAFTAAELSDQRLDELECSDNPVAPTVKDGEAIFVLHTLHEDVEVDEAVRVKVTTPCTSTSASARHDDGKVLLAFVAPPGAECSLGIQADILNAHDRIASQPSSAACELLGHTCATDDGAAGAGGGAPDTNDTMDAAGSGGVPGD